MPLVRFSDEELAHLELALDTYRISMLSPPTSSNDAAMVDTYPKPLEPRDNIRALVVPAASWGGRDERLHISLNSKIREALKGTSSENDD